MICQGKSTEKQVTFVLLFTTYSMRATYSLIPVGRYYYYYGVCMSRAAVAGSIGRLLFFEAGKAKFASPPTKLMDEIYAKN